jgi:hypothetical protein
MFLKITVNMGTQNGSSNHNVMCWHAAKTLDQFNDVLNSCEFIVVEELYKHDRPENIPHRSRYILRKEGPLILNTAMIGKVKLFSELEKAMVAA